MIMADSTKRQADNTLGEEASAFGERVKGAAKDAAGSLTGNRALEREGERENAEGNARQEANNVFDETPGVRGTSSTDRRWIGGSFADRDSAERAYTSAIDRGYTRDDVNVIMSDDTRKRYFDDSTVETELGSKALEGAGAGGAIGTVTGALVGAIAAIGTNVIFPGLGLIVAGPLLGALTGAGAGGLTGGLVGALIGAGIPEDRAKEYEADVRNGRIVMGVNPRTDEDADYFEREWQANRGIRS
jgi:uncharacterized protein YjbJ (UPF0337 family)